MSKCASVPALQSIVWLRRGWEDLRQMEGASLAHGVIISVIGAVLLMLGSTHPYLIAAAVTGYLLVGPIMTTGVCELSRRRAAREPRGFDESLEAVTRNPDALMQFRRHPGADRDRLVRRLDGAAAIDSRHPMSEPLRRSLGRRRRLRQHAGSDRLFLIGRDLCRHGLCRCRSSPCRSSSTGMRRRPRRCGRASRPACTTFRP